MKLTNTQKDVLKKVMNQISEITHQINTIYSVLLWHGFKEESEEFVQSISDISWDLISIGFKMENMLEENKRAEETEKVED